MQSRLLNDEIRMQLTAMFEKDLINPVELVYFSSEVQCDSCDETKQLLDELAELSGLIKVNAYNIEEQPDIAQKYQASLAPTLVITHKNQDQSPDYKHRFLGIPSGYEFSSLIHSIVLVSRRDSGLMPEVRKALQSIKTQVDLKVFVTPT
jgi:alkyl hydroperoxide reductase subunit AhpF